MWRHLTKCHWRVWRKPLSGTTLTCWQQMLHMQFASTATRMFLGGSPIPVKQTTTGIKKHMDNYRASLSNDQVGISRYVKGQACIYVRLSAADPLLRPFSTADWFSWQISTFSVADFHLLMPFPWLIFAADFMEERGSSNFAASLCSWSPTLGERETHGDHKVHG